MRKSQSRRSTPAAAAKKARNFAEADRIRAELLADGVILEDKPGGVTELAPRMTGTAAKHTAETPQLSVPAYWEDAKPN